ncbi:hypothetical protein BST81_18290 [Leptolyngbya sp. 'hensonii']|uniref:hypothetical protein n=1 Tax=Leptolyngbya sp. 'hensonii' TaxID=1922337 RepID=UPI0009500A6F|nr:hypothetical protein [Leptolyngbya sp. 'hensonii']OLP16940.1 hypothetical protein BST81_18290 [Leptolyngbya sp. 'hensonii']
MNLEEFEQQSQEAVEKALNELQTATLLLAELENQVAAAGNSVRSLSQLIEALIRQSSSDRE